MITETAQKRGGPPFKNIRSFSPDVGLTQYKQYTVHSTNLKRFVIFFVSHKQQLNNHKENPQTRQCTKRKLNLN